MDIERPTYQQGMNVNSSQWVQLFEPMHIFIKVNNTLKLCVLEQHSRVTRGDQTFAKPEGRLFALLLTPA